MSDMKKVVLKKAKFVQGLPIFHSHAAGIDIGDTKHDVSIRDENGEFITKEFLSFTEDLHELVKWLLENNITTVAM